MKKAVIIEFMIARNGRLTVDGQFVGCFGSTQAAGDYAIRFAQDAAALYRIFYA